MLIILTYISSLKYVSFAKCIAVYRPLNFLVDIASVISMINSWIEIETAQLFMDGQIKKRETFRIQIEYVSRKMTVFVFVYM